MTGLLALAFLAAGVTPVQKVLQMMEEMKQKAELEKDEEAKLFDQYEDWCKDTSVDRRNNIRTADMDIERLSADVEKHGSEAGRLGDEIAQHSTDVAQWSGDVKAATEVRDGEAEDYAVTHADYVESVVALGRAIQVLKEGAKDVPQTLLAVSSSLRRVPASAKDLVAALLEQPTPPKADAFKSSSGGIVELLEGLEEKFKDEQAALEKAEAEAKHEYNMLSLSLQDQIKRADREREAKEGKKSDHESAGAAATGQLTATQAQKKEDEEYVAELTAQCTLKRESFDTRQTVRAEELEAIAKAIEIIGSQAVKGNAEKHLPKLIQRSFAQLRAAVQRPAQLRAFGLLQRRGRALSSDRLSLLALRVQKDPLAKVVGMIKDMIAKLQEEAGAEAEHKQWCDDELHDNKLTRDAKSQAVTELTARADQLQAALEKLAAETSRLTEEIAQINAAVQEATTLRQKEKSENEAAIADAKEAQKAVEAAQTVLKEFYEKAAFVQTRGPADDAPASFDDEPYSGNQGGSKGILGMLEVIHSDFARVEADTTSDEELAAKEFARFSEESAADLSTKQQAVKKNKTDSTNKDSELHDTKADLKATSSELDSAHKYWEELKPQCTADTVSFEERSEQRKAEIESLKETYEVLNEDA